MEIDIKNKKVKITKIESNGYCSICGKHIGLGYEYMIHKIFKCEIPEKKF